MASPFALPDAVPPPLARGHAFTVAPLGRLRERDQGERRLRPRFRSVPEEVDVSWELTQAEFDALDVFFNDTIGAGEQAFDAQVHLRGSSFTREWFTCQWIGDYEWAVGTQTFDGLTYQVRARFRLLESLGENRVAPGISAGGRDLDAGGARFQPGILRASGTDLDEGSAVFQVDSILASGTDVDAGGWETGLSFAATRITEGGNIRRLEDSAGQRETE